VNQQLESIMAKGPAADGPGNSEARPARRRTLLRFLPVAIILAGFLLGYALGWYERLSLDGLAENRDTLKRIVAENPILAPLGFIVLYALAIAFSFPAAAVLTVLGGFLFGWLAGAFYAIVAATIGGAALFLAARSAFGTFLRNRSGKMAARLAESFEHDAFSHILVLRLAPFIPFFVVSVAPALFNVRLKTFVAATLIGALPGAFAYAWLGQGLDSVLVVARAAGRPVGLSDLVTPEITIAFLALTLVAVLATIVRKVRGPQAS
jgi:uncharacterized membrane protein YdjX (TVP38/TMEM64 family)